MDAPKIKNAADATDYVRSRDLPFVKVGIVDVDGIMRGKYMARDKFDSALEKGFGFCDVVLGWDSNDQLYDNTKLTGWHTAYPDAAGARAAGDHAAHPVRERPAVLPGRIRRLCGGGLPARRAAARAQESRGHGLRGLGRGRVRVLPVRGDAAFRAREELPRPQDHHAGLLRLFGAALRRARGFLSRAPRPRAQDGFRDRGPAHRDRPRRARGRDPRRRRA